jgi:hypothetical protein
VYNGGGDTGNGYGSSLGFRETAPLYSVSSGGVTGLLLDLPVVPLPGSELFLGKRGLLTIYKRLLPRMVRAKLYCEESRDRRRTSSGRPQSWKCCI